MNIIGSKHMKVRFEVKLIQAYKEFKFKLNDEITRNQLKEIIINLIHAEKEILAGWVCCDETNNTPYVLACYDLICDVGWVISHDDHKSFRLSSKYFYAC